MFNQDLKQSLFKNIFVLMFFVLLSIFLTYPLIFMPLDKYIVSDLGDPLLNTAILAWDIKKILNLNFQNFYDINIFYPYRLTLAYSENLLSTAVLFTLPVYLITKSYIIAYNLTILLGFVLSGFCMYILAFYLTKKTVPSVIAGIIFAYAPFKVIHLGHLQLITSMWLPLMILFMHRFFESGHFKNIVFSGIFFFLNATSNGYYMIFATCFIFLMFLFFIFHDKKRIKHVTAGFILFSIIAGVSTLSIYYSYYELQKIMGFKRTLGETLEFSASIKSFISVPPDNVIYKKFLPTDGGERTLFWGFIPTLLLILLFFKKKCFSLNEKYSKQYISFYYFIFGISIILTFGPFFFQERFLPNPLYMLLYNLMPGFNGMRVPVRAGILILLSLGVLCAYSLTFFKRSILSLLIAILIIVEYLNIPIGMVKLPDNGKIPQVYSFLKNLKGDFAVAELPKIERFELSELLNEYKKVYYSIYHEKKLFNGISGFFPPLYLNSIGYPINKLIKLFAEINIRFIIIHKDEFKEKEEYYRLKYLLEHSAVREVYEDEETTVYEILNRNLSFAPGNAYLKDYKLKFVFDQMSIKEHKLYGKIINKGKKPVVLLYRKPVVVEIYNSSNTLVKRIKRDFISQDTSFLMPEEYARFKIKKIKLPQGLYRLKLYQDKIMIGESVVDVIQEKTLAISNPKVQFILNKEIKYIRSGEEQIFPITLINESNMVLHTQGGISDEGRVNLSYHWLDKNGNTIIWDGMRTYLPYDLYQQNKININAIVKATPNPGEYILEFDLVQEGIAWFKDLGNETLRIEVKVIE